LGGSETAIDLGRVGDGRVAKKKGREGYELPGLPEVCPVR
jgi:hypothetical protein